MCIQLIFLCVVNVTFTFSGIILNTLVIVCLLKSSRLRKKLCNFMILVLSCLDLVTVITSHPVLVLQLVLWLNERHDLAAKMNIYLHFTCVFLGFSLLALLVMNIERYLGVYYPIFHRTSVTRRRLLTLLAILFILPTKLIILSTNDLVISFPVALIIFIAIVYPPLVYINYKLFKISRKVRRNNIMSSEVKRKVNTKSISTCLLVVACLMLLTISSSWYLALSFVSRKSTSKNVRLSFIWGNTIYTMNSTFNSLIFFWKNKVLRTEAIKLLKTLKDRLFGS
jgi:hypothetical protein